MSSGNLFLVVAFSSVAVAGQIGHVIAAKGDWCDDAQAICRGPGAKLMGALTVVNSDSRIIRVGKTDINDRIRIRSYDSGREIVFDCRVPLGCQSPLDLKRLGEFDGGRQPAGLKAFFEALRRMSSEQPIAWISYTQSALTPRGPSTPTLTDAVLKLGPDGVDLSPLFIGMPRGKYVAKVCRIRFDGSAECPASENGESFYCGDDSVSVNWNPEAPATVRYNRTATGLVRVSLCDQARRVSDTNASGLIVAPGEFSERVSRFEDARRAAKGLTATEVDPTIEPALRIFLHYLAQH